MFKDTKRPFLEVNWHYSNISGGQTLIRDVKGHKLTSFWCNLKITVKYSTILTQITDFSDLKYDLSWKCFLKYDKDLTHVTDLPDYKLVYVLQYGIQPVARSCTPFRSLIPAFQYMHLLKASSNPQGKTPRWIPFTVPTCPCLREHGDHNTLGADADTHSHQ